MMKTEVKNLSLINHIDIKLLKGVTQDSRKVKEGYLFAAFQGDYVDGRDYISDAIANGATVILSCEDTLVSNNIDALLVKNPRKVFSHIVSEFYKNQPEHIVAVTGTNGKSSVVHLVNQLWHALGKKGAFIGTLSGAMTTPDPVSLHEKLAQMAGDGIESIAIEASSHGIEQYRIDGVHVAVAAFTNFSQDHLDYHKHMDGYFTAKSRLFSEILDQGGVAILNADIPRYKSLLEICKARDIKVLSYGKNGADIKLISNVIKSASQQIEIEVMGGYYSLELPLVGQFQVMNVLCALACVISQYPEKIAELITALSKLEGVTGRMQHVSSNVYVDYAHTPDALENALKSLRLHTNAKLVCVFGCGGDRDKTKRSLMGDIAAKLSDIAIITDDNPRSENPADIRKEILSGINDKNSNIHEISNRRDAIKFAVSQMGVDDILLVAGKGHEQGQIFDGHTQPFDDVKEVEAAMARLNNY